MSGYGRLSILLTCLALLSVLAAAQDRDNELTGVIGRTFISDQGLGGANASVFNPFVRSGKGISFEVDYAHALFRGGIIKLSGEVPVMFNLDEDLNSGVDVVPSDYKQIFVTPAARLNLFPTTAVSPWVSFGGGFGHFSEGSQLIYGGTNPGKSTTTGVIQGGLGLDVKVWKWVNLRAEVRDFWSGEPDFPLADTGKTRQHNYFVGGGFIWHF